MYSGFSIERSRIIYILSIKPMQVFIVDQVLISCQSFQRVPNINAAARDTSLAYIINNLEQLYTPEMRNICPPFNLLD